MGNFDSLPLPPIGSDNTAALLKWVDENVCYTDPLRARDLSSNRRAELYDAGSQWLQKSMAGYDGASASQWTDMYWAPDDPSRIPMPVFNEGIGARRNESARLARPHYRPVVRTKGENPDLKTREGARKRKYMLEHRLREMGWDKEADLAYYHMPVYGGVWLKSEWEQTWDQTTQVPVKGAVACPNCPDMKLASPTIKPQHVSQLGLPGNALEDGQTSLKLDACPQCSAPLLGHKPSLEEAVTLKDVLGRPLGESQPLGDWRLSVRSDYDMFPRNMGYDMRPGSIDDWTEAHVESLDWVALRWPDLVDKLKPENPGALAKYHPIAGAPAYLQGVLDSRLFRNCVRVKERHRKPWMELVVDEATGEKTRQLNRGRSVIAAGETTLFNGPYLMPSVAQPGKDMPRVQIGYVPWEIREGGRRLRGLSLWEIMFDPQDAANEIRSQTQAVRQRLAVPLYLALKTHNFEIQAMRGGIPGTVAEIDVDPLAPTVVPQLINNTTISPGVNVELQDAVEALQRYSDNTDVESGGNPPVDAAAAINLLKEASGEKREPRIKRFKEELQRMLQHGSDLQNAMYLEPRSCRFEDEDGDERWTKIQPGELADNVEVDVEPDETDEDERRLIVKDLIDTQVINPQESKPLRRKIARYFKAPEDLFEDEDIQEASTNREWMAFRDHQRIPVVDLGLDGNQEHYDAHGKKAQGEFFRDLEERCNWDGALRILTPMWGQLKALAAMQSPLSIQDRAAQWWTQMLQQGQFQSPDPEALQLVIGWRSHMEAHRLEEEMKQAMAQQQPMLAAPGADQTASGGQVTPNAPPQEQPPVAGPEMQLAGQPGVPGLVQGQ